MRQELVVQNIRQVNLEMAGGCNLRCPMCTQSTGREKDFLKRLPLEEFKRIIDQAIPLGLQHVTLSGSGEPLLHPGLEEAVATLHARGLTSTIYTNGVRLTPERFENLCKAGLTLAKVSCQGWDRESYAKWMSVDAFDRVRSNLQTCLFLLKTNGYKTQLQTTHLIHDVGQMEQQKQMYIKNWVEFLGVEADIWLEHNWSGLHEGGVPRAALFRDRPRRSCGRPFAPELEIRAGGLDGKHGAVVPCPFVLGQDSKAVLGHTQDLPLTEIMNGEPMRALRAAHLSGDFDSVEYCRNCDQLYDAPESLVWSNVPGRIYGVNPLTGVTYAGVSTPKETLL